MVVTRSSTKSNATRDATVKNSSHDDTEQVSLQGTSPLLDLPPELLLHILNFVIDDESPRISCTIDEPSTGLIVQEPGITQVCQLLRHESIPLFYARKAFLLNIHEDYGYACDALCEDARRIPGKIRYMSKVTFFGRALSGGQASITFDLGGLEMIDARRRYYDHQMRLVPHSDVDDHRGHNHFGPMQLECFQKVLNQAKILINPPESRLSEHEFRSLSALLGLLKEAGCTSFFKGRRPRGIANRGAGPGSGGHCECNELVAVGTHEVVRDKW